MLPWLHPTLVHFAIGLFFAAVLFDVLGLVRSSEKLLFAGFWNTVLGAAATIVAALTGLLSESRLGPHDATGDALLEFHKVFGVAAAVMALALTAFRLAMKGYIRPRSRTIYLTASFLTAAFVLISGGLGGALVYSFGLGVSPSAAQRIVDANAPKAAAPVIVPTPVPQAQPALTEEAKPTQQAAPTPRKRPASGARRITPVK